MSDFDSQSPEQLSNSEKKPEGIWAWLWPFYDEEETKMRYLCLIFSCIIFSYSLIRPLKDAIFISFVGTGSLPWAKLLMIAILPVFMPIYNVINCARRRSRATIIFAISYGIICAAFAVILIHPSIGIRNTLTSNSRILGWIFYGTMDFFSIAVVASFWSMINSISTPKSAGRQYGFMVAASRAAGALSAGLAALLLKSTLPSVFSIPVLLIACASSLFLCSKFIKNLFSNMPERLLTGYSDKRTEGKDKAGGLFDGLKIITKQPYAFGMFWLLCSFELVSTLLNYRMQCLIAQKAANCISGVGSHLFALTFIFQVLGFFLALFGTTSMLKWLGVRFGLLVTPVIIGALSVGLMFSDSLQLISIIMVALKALDYSVDIPVREMLFIPTTHEIQFQAKGWISSFGKTISKTSGSMLNGITRLGGAGSIISSVVSKAPLPISILWIGTAFFVGRRYKQAIDNNELINPGTSEPRA